MITNKTGTERLTFPNNNNNKKSSENKKVKSLSIKNKINFKKNISQQNSAKREGYSQKDANKKKNLSR